MSKISVDGAEIYYEISGDPKTAKRWVTVINGLVDLSQFREQLWNPTPDSDTAILFFDFRGQGNSSAFRQFSFLDLVEDIVYLWNKLGINQSSLVTVCIGCNIALYLATFYSFRTEKLFLINPSPAKKWYKLGFYDWDEDYDSILHRSILLLYPSHSYDAIGYARYTKRLMETTDVIQRRAFLRTTIHSLDIEDLLPKISIPTKIIHGSADGLIDPQVSDYLAANIFGAEIVKIPGVGHSLFGNLVLNENVVFKQVFAT